MYFLHYLLFEKNDFVNSKRFLTIELKIRKEKNKKKKSHKGGKTFDYNKVNCIFS